MIQSSPCVAVFTKYRSHTAQADGRVARQPGNVRVVVRSEAMQRENRCENRNNRSVPTAVLLSNDAIVQDRRGAYEFSRRGVTVMTAVNNRPRERNSAMTAKVVQDEHTAMAQKVTRQPDGPGLRIGKRGELTGIGKVAPGGAKLFRERLPQFQAEAAYWENRIGTVHDFRVFLFDNDTRILFTIVFDGDFKPYVEDLIKEVTPWLDQIFGDVWEGYKGMKDAGILELVHNAKVDAEFFYA